MRPLLLLESRSALNQGVHHYAESIQFFQQAVDLDPSFATARLYLATAYMQQYIPGNDSPENNQTVSSVHSGAVS